MNLLSIDRINESSFIREYRSNVAKMIIKLLNADEFVNGIGWDELDGLPGWVLLTNSELNALVRQVGTAAVGPQLKKSIDGMLFQKITTSVEPGFVQRLFCSDMNGHELEFEAYAQRLIDAPIETIEQIGTSVLIATVENRTLSRILARRFDSDAFSVNSKIAKHIVGLIEELSNLNNEQLHSYNSHKTAQPKMIAEVAMA